MCHCCALLTGKLHCKMLICFEGLKKALFCPEVLPSALRVCSKSCEENFASPEIIIGKYFQ